MKRISIGALAVAFMVLAVAGSARASDHTTPGTPGAANCHGQTAAYLAQAAKNGLVDDAFHGIGGIGRYADLSVQQVQAVIDQFCAQTPS